MAYAVNHNNHAHFENYKCDQKPRLCVSVDICFVMLHWCVFVNVVILVEISEPIGNYSYGDIASGAANILGVLVQPTDIR